jgi:hypothetical protein
MLGNVVTNTASGGISLLSEPRAITLTRFLILGIRAHELNGCGRGATSPQSQIAALSTSMMACIVVNSIAAHNPKAFYDALSRTELETAIISLLQSLIGQPPSNQRVGSAAKERSNEESLIIYVSLAMRAVRCCIRLQNRHPHYCYDPYWSYSVASVVHMHQPSGGSGDLCNRFLQPSNNKNGTSWAVLNIVVALVGRFASPLITNLGHSPEASHLIISKAVKSELSCCLDALSISFLVLADVVNACGSEALLVQVRTARFNDVFASANGGSVTFKSNKTTIAEPLTLLIEQILERFGSLVTGIIQFAMSINHDVKPSAGNNSQSKEGIDVGVAISPLEGATLEIPCRDDDHGPDDLTEREHTDTSNSNPASTKQKKLRSSKAPGKNESEKDSIDLAPLLSPALAMVASLLDHAYDSVISTLSVNATDSIRNHDGLIVAVLRASYLCPDSRSLHLYGLSILASIAKRGGSLFTLPRNAAAALTIGNKKNKISSDKVNEDTLLNHSSAQVKPRTKGESEIQQLPSDLKPEAAGRIIQCAHFVFAAATLTEYDADFYQRFGIVLRSLAASCEASREVLAVISLHYYWWSYCFNLC